MVLFSGTKIGVTIGNPYVRWSRKTGPLLEPVLFRNVSAGIFFVSSRLYHLGSGSIGLWWNLCVWVYTCMQSKWMAWQQQCRLHRKPEWVSQDLSLFFFFFRLCPDVQVRFILFVVASGARSFFSGIVSCCPPKISVLLRHFHSRWIFPEICWKKRGSEMVFVKGSQAKRPKL